MTRTMPSIDETIEFIKQAHEGVEYTPGMPYYEHPVTAMGLLPANTDEEVKLAVLLHDVLEDTSYTAQDLLDRGYTPRTVRAVELVTRHKKNPVTGENEVYGGGVYKEGMSYLDWIKAILDTKEMDAALVKYADMKMNSDPIALAALPEEKRDWFKQKYTLPFALICDTLQKAGLIEQSGWSRSANTN